MHTWYVCLSIFRTFGNFSLRTSAFRLNSKYSDTSSPAGHIDWSRSWRDPCTLERNAGAQMFFSGGSGRRFFWFPYENQMPYFVRAYLRNVIFFTMDIVYEPRTSTICLRLNTTYNSIQQQSRERGEPQTHPTLQPCCPAAEEAAAQWAATGTCGRPTWA